MFTFKTCCWSLVVAAGLASPASALTLREAVQAAIATYPSLEAAAANRRATEHELRQAEGRKLPRLDVDADIGGERIDRPGGFTPDVNNRWRLRRETGLTFTHVLFDGWERTNDIYRNGARVDAAALRVLARGEIVALDAIEAYIDVRRHQRVMDIARDNLAAHRRILGRVREQATAGKAAQSDVTQVEERVAAAEATIERIRQSLLEAQVKFERLVGRKPVGLQAAGYPSGIPATRSAARAGVDGSPLLAAAGADAEVARLAFEQSKSAHYPTVALEVRGLTGADIGGTPGRDNEVASRLVMKWTLFDGFISRHRQLEFAERWAQASAERDERERLVREEIERAMVVYQTDGARLTPLRRQVRLAGEVVRNYDTEYGLAKRSLLDLLNAENARFNVAVEVATTEALHVFAAYRILGAMGGLLTVLGIAAPSGSQERPAWTTHCHTCQPSKP